MIRPADATFDLVIAGAGPAGLATAIRASMCGLRPLVLEARRELTDKACGEGIMPGGVLALEAMGVRLKSHESHRFAGIRYIEEDLVAEGHFRHGYGLGVRRTVLARALLERARELGAEIRFGCRVESWESGDAHVRVRTASGDVVHGRLLVGADGLHSHIRSAAGLRGAPRRVRGDESTGTTLGEARRFGIRQHFAVKPWSDLVEVHLADRVEAYITPVAPDIVGVALLLEAANEGNSDTSFASMLAQFPAVERQLAGAAPLDPARGAGPLRQRVRKRVAGRVALVGDAAGYLDALTGQGLELGFAAAAALVKTVHSGAPLTQYEAAYRHLTRDYYRLTGFLLRATRHRSTRRGLVRLLGAVPFAFDRLLDRF